jgi:ABC-2 type transport system ATP-binding protein
MNGVGSVAAQSGAAATETGTSTDTDTVVQVSGLRKVYGSTVAVDEVSFEVRRGEIFGVIGPNGAGKTTTVECLVGLRAPDAGTLRVLGQQPRGAQGRRLREHVGVQLQQSALPARIKVREALDLYASFYPNPVDPDALLRTLGLEEKQGTTYRKLSGGQKQRLSIALALIGDPQIAVLDELTTGLDPQARRETWALIERVRDRGVTVVLVTHFMDEAERLCDRLVLIDAGRVVAQGTPAQVAEQGGGDKRVRFRPSGAFDDALLTGLPQVSRVVRQGSRVVVTGRGDLVNAVILTLDRAGVAAHDVALETAGLEDAFIALTRHGDAGVKEGSDDNADH